MDCRNSRRSVLIGLLAGTTGCGLESAYGQATGASSDRVGERLSPWKPGTVDIHHISTGRGDASLIIGPDGTVIVVDTGAMYEPPPLNLPLRPNNSLRPGQWVGRYVKRHIAAAGRSSVDHLLVTHIHPDHVGDVAPNLPKSADGSYSLTGISDLAELVPVRNLYDRGFPDYENVAIKSAAFAQNYISYVRSRQLAGLRTERLSPGSEGQVSLTARRSYGAWSFRILAVNGQVWTGSGNEVISTFPAMNTLSAADIPDENMYSAAFRLSFGNFSYFVAGDLTSNTFDGLQPWRDVEAKAAKVAGQVDVAVASHHGLFDATGAEVVQALRPRVWIIDGWHVSHPSITTLERIFSQRLYQGERDVLATGLAMENALVNKRLTDRLRASEGHVIVRVGNDGGSFTVVTTGNADESDFVQQVYGRYTTS